jgi:3-hydroxyisobutyrate dehydrogenase-like beta-hydroxyacid dehydrogenase
MASKQPQVGFVGLGIMGSAMSNNLLKADFLLVGFDVDPARMTAFAFNGGTAAASATEVAKQCDLVITSLPSAAALQATAAGLAASGRRDVVVAECSTLPLEDKEAARKTLAAAGIVLLDSPLSGTGAQAVKKDIIVFGSGDKAAYEKFLPVYQGISRAQHYLGDFGNGSRLKFVANLLVAIHNVAGAEALVLAKKCGLDAGTAFNVLRESAGTSRMFEVRGPSMVAGTYLPAMMKNELWMKDLHIIGDFATGLRCPTPLFALSSEFYAAALAMGYAAEDTGAVHAVLSTMAGLK